MFFVFRSQALCSAPQKPEHRSRAACRPSTPDTSGCMSPTRTRWGSVLFADTKPDFAPLYSSVLPAGGAVRETPQPGVGAAPRQQQEQLFTVQLVKNWFIYSFQRSRQHYQLSAANRKSWSTLNQMFLIYKVLL